LLTAEHRASGLIVARDSMDEASVQRALKRLDRRFCLQKHPRDGVEGGWVYKVICFVSDAYAPVVLTWMDEHGRPLPLSSSIVDEMQKHMLGARNKGLSADEHNARLTERKRREADDRTRAVIDDHRPYVERDRVSVSLADTKKRPYWRAA
jgi:hypothetical protein